MTSWITTNYHERLQDFSLDFKCYIKKSKFDRISFEQAANNVALMIANLNKKIFVGFSGGYDSEFVVRRFHSLKINFTPIIICLESFSYEREYAYKTLRDLKIEAIVYKMTMEEYIQLCYEYCYKTVRALEASPISYFLHNYAKNNDGILVVPDHIGGMVTTPWNFTHDWRNKNIEENIIKYSNETKKYLITDGGLNHNIIKTQKFYMKDEDMYHHSMFPDSYHIFFMKTPQIVVSMLDAIQDDDMNWNDYKERLYGLSWRPKLGSHFRNFFTGDEEKIKKILDLRQFIGRIDRPKSNSIHHFGSKDDLINLIIEDVHSTTTL